MSERADAYIDSSKSYMYNILVDDTNSLFYHKNKTEVYVAAASIGFYFKKSDKIPSSNKQALFVSTTLGKSSVNLLWILKSIGISVDGIDSLNDLRKVMSLCDEYANYGIEYIYDIHTNRTSTEANELASTMADILDEYESEGIFIPDD